MKRTILLVVAALLLAACGHSFNAATPKGFVELEDQEDQGYDYRATTADGLVIAVREIDNDPEGPIEFWSRAIENSMRQRGGYALLGQRDVKNVDGLAGKQLRFGHDEASKPHLYYVTLYVTPKRLYVLEAGGTKQQMESHEAQLDWSFKNFRLK
jgi:hypothetical protein